KRVWLKPGKKYLFGRVKRNGVRHAIDNATISRHHLVIEVGHVRPGDGMHVEARSRLLVTDQKTTCGTVVDGESINGSSKELKGDEHLIRIGKYPHPLKIKWHPIVLSFSFPCKAKDPLKHALSSLEDLDVKTIIPYIVDRTTHVVQSKRNTTKGLHALINGKYIVYKSYIQAIVYATTPGDLEREESLCPLEEDYDAAWPDPTQHLPPRGKEPTQSPDTSYQPNPNRINVFDGCTFIFCERTRFEDLQGPITNGHGKALLFEINRGQTTPDDVVAFMKQTAGNKRLGQIDGGGGVGLVQFRKASELDSWDIRIEHQIACKTGQKLIDPSQFLDAILANEASLLFRPHQREELPVSGSNQPLRFPVVDTQAVTQTMRRSRARLFINRFKSFDDGFDMDSIPAYTLEQGDRREETPQAMIPDSASAQPQTDLPLHGEEDAMAELLPGAAAMKLHISRCRKRGKLTPPAEQPQKPKKQKLNVMEAARQRRQAVDEAIMQEQEKDIASFREMTESVDVERMRNLAIIEEMDIPVISWGQNVPSCSARYDERWNGRKNFKKFRRKGHGTVGLHRVQSVIVPLEEAKRKHFSLGETYWTINKSLPTRRYSQSQETPIVQQTFDTAPKSPTPPLRIGKRPRDTEKSDSEDGLRFRFRRRKER
ncbi:hypothetical protein ACO22_07641, partial [Paracoccidioides brasiliensis]